MEKNKNNEGSLYKVMKKEKLYTEYDLRKAYTEGWYTRQDNSYADITESIDEYIESLNPKQKEETVSFTYSFLRRKLDWEEFCNLTGIDYYAIKNGYRIEDNEIFKLTESQAKKFNLI